MLRIRTRSAIRIALIAITTLSAGIAIGWRIGVANKPNACPTVKGATPISSLDTAGTKQGCTFAPSYGRAMFRLEI